MTSQALKLRARRLRCRHKANAIECADARIVLILSKQVVLRRFACATMHCVASSSARSKRMQRASQSSLPITTRASTRFVKWSRCFLRSGVIGLPCSSIRDGTFSIAPSLTWRAQWRNVRRQRPRRLRRRRSALRSGSRRAPFSSHVTEPAASTRAITFRARHRRLQCNDGGRRRDNIRSLRRPRSVWTPVLSIFASRSCRRSIYPAFAFRRVLHALQNFGQVMFFSTLPAFFASRHSVPHCF